MQKQNFTTALLVNRTPEEVFNAINNVSEWWSETVEGATSKLNNEFIYRHKDMHYSKLACDRQLFELSKKEKR